MIVRTEPKSDTKEAAKLSKFFSNKDNTIYPIQSDLQRRYCWPSTHIDKFFKDYIVDLYERNKEADENGEDSLFARIGDAILTKEENDNSLGPKCKKQEIIDMSQRITTVMSFIVVLLYVYADKNDIKTEEERRELYNKYLRTKNNKSYKVISTFKNNDFEEVIEGCIKGTFKTDEKTIKELTKIFDEKKKNEINYKSFRSICAYVYRLVQTTIGTDDMAIKDRLDLFLDKTYIQVEICEKEERVEKFREVNTYRVGIANKDIYKTLLCAKGDDGEIDSKFQDFEAKIETITKPKRINILKSPITVTEYILKTALIVLDDTRETCKSTFSLDDDNNGLAHHLNKGLLDTEEKVLNYLDICIDICDFLTKSMEYKQEGFNEEWYLLTENHTRPFIWLYNILPAYAISKIKDEEKKSFAFEMLLKSFMIYSIKYAVNRSVQYIQTYMYSFAKEILEDCDKKYCLEDFKTDIIRLYNKTFSEFIFNDLTGTIKMLNYSLSSSKSGIYAILSYIEYLAQKQSGIKRDNLYRLIKKDEIELDHIFPRSKKTDDNEKDIDSIGNLVFLEKSLNASKQDVELATSEKYGDSSFISTKLIIRGNRYEGLTNEQIVSISENVIPYNGSKDMINNFSTDLIRSRENDIASLIKKLAQNSNI